MKNKKSIRNSLSYIFFLLFYLLLCFLYSSTEYHLFSTNKYLFVILQLVMLFVISFQYQFLIFPLMIIVLQNLIKMNCQLNSQLRVKFSILIQLLFIIFHFILYIECNSFNKTSIFQTCLLHTTNRSSSSKS